MSKIRSVCFYEKEEKMKKSNLLTLFFLTLFRASCKTTLKTDDPNVRVKGEGYEVEIDNSNHGTFCPPGQAKKGNC